MSTDFEAQLTACHFLPVCSWSIRLSIRLLSLREQYLPCRVVVRDKLNIESVCSSQ